MQSRVHGHDARGNGVTGVRISYAFRTFLIDLDMEIVLSIIGTALVISVSSITITIAITNAAETIAKAIKEKK